MNTNRNTHGTDHRWGKSKYQDLLKHSCMCMNWGLSWLSRFLPLQKQIGVQSSFHAKQNRDRSFHAWPIIKVFFRLHKTGKVVFRSGKTGKIFSGLAELGKSWFSGLTKLGMIFFRFDETGKTVFRLIKLGKCFSGLTKLGKQLSGLAIIGKLVFRFGKIGKLVFRPLDNCVARLLHDVINYRLAKIISHMDPSIVSSSSSSSCTVLIFGVEGIYLLAKCCHSCGPLLLEVGGQHGNASFSSLLSAVFNSGVEGSCLLSQLWPFVLEGVGSAWEYLLLLLFLLLHHLLLHHLFLLLIRRGLYFWRRGQLFGGRNACAVVAVCSWRLGSAARTPGWMALAPGRCPAPAWWGEMSERTFIMQWSRSQKTTLLLTLLQPFPCRFLLRIISKRVFAKTRNIGTSLVAHKIGTNPVSYTHLTLPTRRWV